MQIALSEEESASEQDDSSDAHRVGPRPRANKAHRKQSLSQWDVIVEGATKEVAMSRMDDTRKVELGVGSARRQPHTWKPKAPLFNKLGLQRQVQRCPFGGTANANCGAGLRMTEDKEGLWTVERNRIPHADHKTLQQEERSVQIHEIGRGISQQERIIWTHGGETYAQRARSHHIDGARHDSRCAET